MPDITDLAHERDGDGNLLPIEKEIDVRGSDEPVTVEVIPATSGQRSEWNLKLDDADDELSAEMEAELFETFTEYDPADFGGEDWSDIRPALADALANAIFAEVFDTEEDDFSEFIQNAQAQVATDLGNEMAED